MISFLPHEKIDKQKWDQCIDDSINGMIYGYSWYLDIVCPLWTGIVEDNYESVMPLCVGKKYGIPYLYQPKFSQQLGVFSKNSNRLNDITPFVEAIIKNYQFVEIFFNSQNHFPEDLFSVEKKINLELDLNKPYEDLSNQYTTNLKRNISKALQSGISVHKNIRPEEIISIFKENKGKIIHGLGSHDYHVLEKLIYTCIYKGKAEIWGVYTNKNQLCAGVFFIRSHKRFIFLFSGTDKIAKELGAMPLLVDTFIKENANHAMILDFEGSSNINLARFYRSFGSKEHYYHFLNINKLPLLTKLGVQLVKLLKKRYF